MSESRLIVGLGNPGKRYEETRHNLGFRVVRSLAKRLNVKLSRKLFLKGYLAAAEVEGFDVSLLLPTTYMNNSGLTLRRFLKNNPFVFSDILVVCDDVNLTFGGIRIKSQGSSGGHNGLSSLMQHLGSDQFARLRLGVGSPLGKKELADFVLSDFSKKEKEDLGSFVEKAVECCIVWVTGGVERAMNQFNKRNKDD